MDRRFNHPDHGATERIGKPAPPSAPLAWSDEVAEDQAATSYAALPDAPTQYGHALADATLPARVPGHSADALPPLPWFKRPAVLFCIAATAAAIAVAGLIATTLSPRDVTDSVPSSATTSPAPPPKRTPTSPTEALPNPPASSSPAGPSGQACPEGTVASGQRCIVNPRMCPDGTVVGVGEPCAQPRAAGPQGPRRTDE